MNSKSMVNGSQWPLRAWVVWALSSLFLFYKYVIEVSPSVMTSYLMKEYGLDGAALGSLAATYFYAYLFMQIPAGLLIDKIGARSMTTVAILLCAFGSLMFGMSTTFAIATIGRFITGIGASFATVNCLKLISSWFPLSRFALMTGLMMTVGMLGAAGGQAPLAHAIHAFGERESIQLFAWIGVVLSALFWLIVRDHKSPSIAQHQKKQNVKMSTIVKTIIKDRQSWLLSLYSGLAFAPVSTFGGLWGVPFFAEVYGLSTAQAAHKVTLIFLGFAVGAPLLGWFSDVIRSRKKVMGVGTAIAFVLMCMVLYLPPIHPAILGGLLFLMGVSLSGFLVSFTMIREVHRPLMAATAIGFMNTFDAIFGAVSDPLTGWILDLNARFSAHAYRISLSVLPLYLAIAFLLLWTIRETYKKGHSSVPPSFP